MMGKTIEIPIVWYSVLHATDFLNSDSSQNGNEIVEIIFCISIGPYIPEVLRMWHVELTEYMQLESPLQIDLMQFSPISHLKRY